VSAGRPRIDPELAARLSALASSMEEELHGNILSFWLPFMDEKGGGFSGWIENDRTVKEGAPKGLVAHARFLWTYSTAYRRFRKPEHMAAADHAYAFLTGALSDPESGGFWFLVDASGKPMGEEKIVYGQAFAIYALSEYYLASGREEALDIAMKTFGLLEASVRDKALGGYAEAADRGFKGPRVKALSDVDIPCAKSMNTNLHVLEALSALFIASGESAVREALRSLARTFASRVFPGNEHMALYFDADWKSLTDHVSYGHDIEASWLLAEAAELAWGEGADSWPSPILDRVLGSARAALGVFNANGHSMPNETHGGRLDGDRIWWVQAETMVGFINAFQMTGEGAFLQAAEREWAYIRDKVIDSRHGEWFWAVKADGRPDEGKPKGSPWKTSYHNGRACMEVMRRAAETAREAGKA
jgi:mannobiose 2-epimerase